MIESLIGFGVLLALILFRVPIAFAMAAVGGIGFALMRGWEPAWAMTGQVAFDTALSYSLSVIPLFIFMGNVLAASGVAHGLFAGADRLFGRFRGGLALASVFSCGAFSAVCGSSLATAATMSKVAMPSMRKFGYDDRLATGSIAAGGTLGILIPPSVALVIYAIVVEASIIEMFQAAIVPGIIAVIFFLALIRFRIWRNPDLAPGLVPMSDEDVRAAVLRLIPVGLIFGIIIVGLGMGLFTPTPAAAVGVGLILAYGAILRLFSDHGLTWPRLRAALLSTAKTASMIYFILFSADILKGFFARSGLPAAMSDWAAASGLDPYVILIAMLVILIVLGCFMESLSMILVIVPFFWPVLIELNGGDYVTASTAAFGMSNDDLRIWFGILALVVVELGLITPPVGLNVFVIKSFSPRTGIGTIFRGVAPFFAIELVRVAVLVLIPGLSLYLTRLL
jgi:tripartite ATP-independent transporter DctM subunit